MITECVFTDSILRIDYHHMLKNLSDEDLICAANKFCEETGKKVCCKDEMFSDLKKRFSDPKIIEMYKTKFSSAKLGIPVRLRSAIDRNDTSEL